MSDNTRDVPAQERVGRDAILVAGMHRSGTSSVAGTIVRLGATPPRSLMIANCFNSRGYWESMALMALNDEIISVAGSTWDDWRVLNISWQASLIAKEFEHRAVAELDREFGDSKLIVIKDPRICRMIPFWLKVLQHSRRTLRVIIPIRSPLEVSRSLLVRDGIPINKSLLLWLRHVLDAEVETRELPRAFIDWSTFIADWRPAMSRVSEHIALSWPRLLEEAALEVDQFLAPELQHHISTPAELAIHPTINNWVRESYHALIVLVNRPFSNSARKTLDDIRLEFDNAAKIFGGLFTDFEDRLSLARKEITAANQENESLFLKLQSYQQEIVEERERLAEAQSRHAAHISNLLGELQAEIAEKRRFALETAARVRRLRQLAGKDGAAAEFQSFEAQTEQQLPAGAAESLPKFARHIGEDKSQSCVQREDAKAA